MTVTFVAIFYLSTGAPVLELHNQRTAVLCKRAASSIVRNVRMPGNLKLSGVTFKCVPREGKS